MRETGNQLKSNIKLMCVRDNNLQGMHDIEVDDTCCEKMKNFKVDHDDKDKSDDVVHPHQMTENRSPQEEGCHFPGDEDEFDEDNPPIRHVVEFTDDYDILAPYFLRFPFEDEEDFNYKRFYGHRCSKEAHQTILRYLNQIRQSFAFDVDCYPPSWFPTARLMPIDLTAAEGTFPSKSREKAYLDFIDWLWEAAKVAVEDINRAIGSEIETSGKGFKFVGLEKAVTHPPGVHFLTINVIEVEVANASFEVEVANASEDEGEGALRKTIQAIVIRNSHGIYQVTQWRVKPVPCC